MTAGSLAAASWSPAGPGIVSPARVGRVRNRDVQPLDARRGPAHSAPGSTVTMERSAHVATSWQREAADLLELAVAGSGQSVTQSVTGPRANGSFRVGWRSRRWAIHSWEKLAPAVGFEPTTKRLTAARSTTELRRSEGRTRRGVRRWRPEGPRRARV